MRSSIAIVCLLLVATPAWAARTKVVGWDSCDERESTESGTAGNSTISGTARTGRCAIQLAPASGGAAAHCVAIAPADNEVFSRVAARVSTQPGVSRILAGFRLGAISAYGCTAWQNPDRSLTVRYRDAFAYQEFGTTAALPSACSSDAQCGGGKCVSSLCYHTLEFREYHKNPATCDGSCTATCELWVNGAKAVSGTADNIVGDTPGASHYADVTEFCVGSVATGSGTYTAQFDDLALDSSVRVGVGRAVPLNPNGGGASGWSNCSTTKSTCVDDYVAAAPTTDDGDATHLLETSSGTTTTFDMETTTLGANESLSSVSAFAVGRETGANSGDYRVNTIINSVTTNGPTVDPPDTTYAPQGFAIATTGGWSQGNLDGMQTSIEHRTNSGSVRVTAVLAYADIKEPDPPIRQNLQDWNGDGRLTIAAFGDSTTRGTGIGSCSLDASVQCSTSDECQPPLTGSDLGICKNTGKYPTVLGSLLTQGFARSTTMFNCGLAGNTAADLVSRAPSLITGQGLVNKRYCRNHMPTECTPDSGTCTGANCASVDCAPQNNGASFCSLSCDLTIGSKVCSGTHLRDCTVDADCSGSTCVGGSNQGAVCTVSSTCTGGGTCTAGGTCADYPAPDYVLPLVGFNELVGGVYDECDNVFGFGLPCPKSTAGSPSATPTPGFYACTRAACSAATECAAGTGGLCSNDFTKACDADGDCSGGGTCSHARARGVSLCFSTCETSTTQECFGTNVCYGGSNLGAACSADSTCTGGGVCGASDCPTGEMCLSSAKMCGCPCSAIPCVTDADCGPGLVVKGARTHRQYGTCVSGACTNCGGAFANTVQPQYRALRTTGGINGEWIAQNLLALRGLLVASPARPIWLTYLLVDETNSGLFLAPGGTRDDLAMVRRAMLAGTFGPNVVDVWFAQKLADQMIANKRCNNDPALLCTSNADCNGVGAACVVYASTLRPSNDTVHANALGAQVIGQAAFSYLAKLKPVCSLDVTTGCGRCSTTTATTCTSSDDCPSTEKCVATTSVCSGAGKGTCTEERAGKLCTRDLTTSCTTDGDCTGKGVCRSEGLLAPGEG